MAAITAIDASLVSWERRALSRIGIANILAEMNGGRISRAVMNKAVATGMATYIIGPAAAHMALRLESEMGSTPGCHRHHMTGITTRRLQRGGDFITYDVYS
jgi:hypothetical protein